MKNDYSRFDFWVERYQDEKYYYIRVKKEWVQVSFEVYSTCRNSYRKINRDNERDYEVIYHYDYLELAEKYYFEQQDKDVINLIYENTQTQILKKVFEYLTEEEKIILHQIYFNNKSERDVANLLHLPYSTLHNRKIKLLKKLKRYLEQNHF